MLSKTKVICITGGRQLLNSPIMIFTQNSKYDPKVLGNKIQLIPKWPPFKHYFVGLQTSPYCIVQAKYSFESQVKEQANKG